MRNTPMDFERPHRSTSSSNTNELFICFTSLLSNSSSMKMSSINSTSSINLSPSRSRSSDQSKNSRLRPTNSIKRSPMFPSGSTKKRSGSAFDNPEPSSPKVTCIGQVRARRSKKQGNIKMMRIRSKRSRNGNHDHEQRWVHFPLTICEGIKAFFPCNSSSSCIARSEEEKEERERSCGSVLEMMVEREKEERGEIRSRMAFDGLEFNDEQEDESRKSVSICIPPKNALLLMRCRSDPVKMAALANRLLEYSNPENEELELDEFEGEGKVAPPFLQETELKTDEEYQKSVTDDQENPNPENEENPERSLQIEKNVDVNPEKCLEIDHKLKEDEEGEEQKLDMDYKIQLEKEILMLVEEKALHEGSKPEDAKTHTGEEVGFDGSKERESKNNRETEDSVLPDCLLLMMCEPKLSMEVSKETWVCSTDFIRWLPARERKTKVIKMNGQDEPKKRISIENNNPAQCTQQQSVQPPRSSCSFPAQTAYGVMASLIEEKLVTAKAYEPFVLTRCKSEPKKSAVKLAPEACFCKNRKLEPHRPATVSVTAAELGF